MNILLAVVFTILVFLSCQTQKKNLEQELSAAMKPSPLAMADPDSMDLLLKLELLLDSSEASLVLTDEQISRILPVLESWREALDANQSTENRTYAGLISLELTEEQLAFNPVREQQPPRHDPSEDMEALSGDPGPGRGGPGGAGPGGPGAPGMDRPGKGEAGPSDPDQFNFRMLIDRVIEKMSELK